MPVTPTPDDGARHTGELDWNEAARPTYSGSSAQASSPHLGAAAQHLVDVHNSLRSELTQVRQLVDQVRSGHLEVGAARSAINAMTLRQNNWEVGAYCQRYCFAVTQHHLLEDRGIFPHLRDREPETGEVLDRLQEEHEVIHDVLNTFDRALVELVESEGAGEVGSAALDKLQHELDMLTDTMLSHLAYEERELIGPIARHGLH